MICGVSDLVHHFLSPRVDGSNVGPHPLPGDALDGEPSTVDVEKHPSILLLLLPGRVRANVGGGGGRLALGAAAEQAVRAGALGAAVSAQLGRGGASPAGGVGSSHWSQEGRVEEQEQQSSSATRGTPLWSLLDRA